MGFKLEVGAGSITTALPAGKPALCCPACCAGDNNITGPTAAIMWAAVTSMPSDFF
jgi:hypothetical protein